MALTLSNTLKITAAAVTLAVAGAALPGVSTEAEAKKIVFKKVYHSKVFFGGHRHHHRRHGVILVGGFGGGCYWLKERALDTGRPYWWARYAACRGY